MHPLRPAILLATLGLYAVERPVSAAPAPAVDTTLVPESTIPVLIGVDLAWAKAQLEERIPKRLYQEQGREVARGISIDVQIERRDLRLRTTADRIGASTELLLDLDVRTSFGNLSGRLGRCRAIVAVDVDMSLRFSPEGKLSPPETTAAVREPCSLSGFNVTPILERELEQRLADARALAQKHLDEFNLELAKVSQEATRRIAQPVSGCLRFVPDKILQGPVETDGSVASIWLALSGKVAEDCAANEKPRLAFESVDPAPRFEFASSLRIPMSEFRAGLARHLDGANDRIELLAVRARRLDGKDLLALKVRKRQRSAWILTRPEIRTDLLTLTVEQAKSTPLHAAIKQRLETFTWQFDPRAADALSARLNAMAREYSVLLGAPTELRDRRLTVLESKTTSGATLASDAILVIRRHQAYIAR